MDRRNIGLDEIAAHNLLIALGLDPSAGHLSITAKHFRSHREGAERRRMETAEESMLQHLEAAFMGNDSLQEEDRASGYAAAQQEAMNWFSDNAATYAELPPVSKGSLLRSMLRDRKHRNAIVTRRQT